LIPPLVIDAWTAEILPRLSRTEDGVSGSAQFSALALDQLPHPVAGGDVVVVDLRAEAHGFLNGHAVSWYALHNHGAAPEASSRVERELLSHLAGQVGQTVLLGTKASALNGEPPPHQVVVESVSDERQLVEARGLRYLRLPVADHSGPEPWIKDAFVAAATHWGALDHVHFHCRGGKGRTATFRAMWARLRGDRTETFDDWLAHQAAATGYDLRSLPAPDLWKRPLIEARLDFLKRFHAETSG